MHTQSKVLKDALDLPGGARFYRCALQVNPFAYLSRHSKQTSFQSEAEYNQAIVDRCLEKNIEVIAVTDHYRTEDSVGLVNCARENGLSAFSGFEAVTKDGVHFLCLFDRDKENNLATYRGECGIHDINEESPPGKLDSEELLEHSRTWGAICIAAHVAGNGGLLKTLSGQARMKVWKSPNLLACAVPGPVSAAPDGIRQILENKDDKHKRKRPPAIINASDVNDPKDLDGDRTSCFIKMSEVSVEALRQAFLDPESRVRLHSDMKPEPHSEFLAMTWEGGFLSDTSVHFNGNLNVLVGGRGTGKSTAIESIRYVLNLKPLGEEALKAYEGIVRHVLSPGTKISMLVRSHKPSEAYYTVERSVPNPPIVKDENGEILALSPAEVMPGVEVFGQHEISELTKSREKLTLLLDRFVERDPSLSGRKAKLRLKLERSRNRILDVQREIEALDERLAKLPGLEETQKRFEKAGLAERLKQKSMLVREERLFSNAKERLGQMRALYNELIEELPIDTAFVSEKALEGLPNADTLLEIRTIFETLSKNLSKVVGQFAEAVSETDKTIAEIKSRWDEKRKTIEETYEQLLRELQKSKIDGAEFIQLRRQIEELRPLKDKAKTLKRNLSVYESDRRKLLSEWEDIKTSEYREVAKASKKVSKKLRDRVRVEVKMAGNRDPFERLLREVGGKLAAAFEKLREIDQLSLQEFAEQCRKGKEVLMEKYNFPSGAAERIAKASPDLFMRIEELELPATTKIELNTAAEGASSAWQSLESLSTGQKATAVLLLLLLESNSPLIVDQPEDDLDNRFITESIVPIMRKEKLRRQFVFSTHNANIPVLGDAELILGLDVSGETETVQANIVPEHMSSIDSRIVRELVEEILEGGKDAFEMRRSKYGF